MIYINDITRIPESPIMIMHSANSNNFFSSKSKEVIQRMANAYMMTLFKGLQMDSWDLMLTEINIYYLG